MILRTMYAGAKIIAFKDKQNPDNFDIFQVHGSAQDYMYTVHENDLQDIRDGVYCKKEN